jgi:hypothetical protein
MGPGMDEIDEFLATQLRPMGIFIDSLLRQDTAISEDSKALKIVEDSDATLVVVSFLRNNLDQIAEWFRDSSKYDQQPTTNHNITIATSACADS